MLHETSFPIAGSRRRLLLPSSLALLALALGLGAARAQAPQAASPAGPEEVVKYVDTQPGQEKAALAALRKYRAGALKEAGNLREILLQEVGRPSRFAVVEKWKDAAAYAAHVGAPAKTALDADTAAIARAPNDDRDGFDFLAQEGSKPSSSALFVVTYCDVNPPNRAKTEVAIRTLVDASRKEIGAMEFDVFRPKKQANLNHFILIQAWSNAKALAAHGKAPATLAFRRTVAPLIGALYDDRVYRQVK